MNDFIIELNNLIEKSKVSHLSASAKYDIKEIENEITTLLEKKHTKVVISRFRFLLRKYDRYLRTYGFENKLAECKCNEKLYWCECGKGYCFMGKVFMCLKCFVEKEKK